MYLAYLPEKAMWAIVINLYVCICQVLLSSTFSESTESFCRCVKPIDDTLYLPLLMIGSPMSTDMKQKKQKNKNLHRFTSTWKGHTLSQK